MTFLMGSERTVTYPRGYDNSGLEQSKGRIPLAQSPRRCDILHTRFRVTIWVPSALIVQRNGRERGVHVGQGQEVGT